MRQPSTVVKAPLGTVRKVKVYEEVAGQIQRLIIAGKLKPGDRLPPERELAETCGVSRASVREAIRLLETLGLAEPRHGEGTIIRDLNPRSLVYPLATLLTRKRTMLAEVLDVRKMIEPPLAARAAAEASADEIARLAEILASQEEKVRRGELPIEEDSRFHYTIATVARNSVALKVVDVLMDLLQESRQRSLQVKGRLQKSLEGHRRVLAAIRRRHPAAAEAAMRRHIEEVHEVLLRQGAGREKPKSTGAIPLRLAGGKHD